MTSIEELDKDWEGFLADFTKAEGDQLAYLRIYRQMTSKQDICAKNIKHLKYLLSQLKKDVESVRGKKDLSEDQKTNLDEKQTQSGRVAAKIAEMERELPVRDNGYYLNVILGSNLNISLLNTDDRYRYKKEYESFKLSVTCVILILFCVAFMLPPFLRSMDALCNFLLVWYYCTLTIRESILRVNGSRIKGWWVTHHYISCVLCAITLTWRDGECYELVRPVFILLVVYVGSVQLIQYKYQTGCLRRLHALGQRHSMDITVEGFSSWMFKGLTFLLPFLIGGYIIQGYCSYHLFYMYFHLDCSRDWQVLVLAILFATITIGNVITIAMVIGKKFTEKNKTDSVSQMAQKYRPKAL